MRRSGRKKEDGHHVVSDRLFFLPARTAALSVDIQTGVVSVYVKDDDFIPRTAVYSIWRGTVECASFT